MATNCAMRRLGYGALALRSVTARVAVLLVDVDISCPGGPQSMRRPDGGTSYGRQHSASRGRRPWRARPRPRPPVHPTLATTGDNANALRPRALVGGGERCEMWFVRLLLLRSSRAQRFLERLVVCASVRLCRALLAAQADTPVGLRGVGAPLPPCGGSARSAPGFLAIAAQP